MVPIKTRFRSIFNKYYQLFYNLGELYIHILYIMSAESEIGTQRTNEYIKSLENIINILKDNIKSIESERHTYINRTLNDLERKELNKLNIELETANEDLRSFKEKLTKMINNRGMGQGYGGNKRISYKKTKKNNKTHKKQSNHKKKV